MATSGFMDGVEHLRDSVFRFLHGDHCGTEKTPRFLRPA